TKFDALMAIMSGSQQNQRNPSRSRSPQARNPPDNPTPSTGDSTLANKQFKPEEIGYFDPELGIEDDSVVMGDKEWIQNVFVFIQRIKDIASIKGDEIVRTNLPLCLRGAAAAWYTDLLNDIEKAGLRSDLKLWYDTLKERFRENPAVALSKL